MISHANIYFWSIYFCYYDIFLIDRLINIFLSIFPKGRSDVLEGVIEGLIQSPKSPLARSDLRCLFSLRIVTTRGRQQIPWHPYLESHVAICGDFRMTIVRSLRKWRPFRNLDPVVKIPLKMLWVHLFQCGVKHQNAPKKLCVVIRNVEVEYGQALSCILWKISLK